MQPDGKVVAGGSFSGINGVACWNVARLIAGITPEITFQPQGRTVTAGESVTFTVAASGDSPLSHQWRKDGINLLGSNSSSLTLINVQKSDEGLYSVVVSNAFGSVISSDAVLHVHIPDPGDMVERLLALVNAKAARPQPLNATLSAAQASIQRHNPISAMNQVAAFQNQVRAQVAPADPALAATLIRAAQDVIDTLSGNNAKHCIPPPGGSIH